MGWFVHDIVRSVSAWDAIDSMRVWMVMGSNSWNVYADACEMGAGGCAPCSVRASSLCALAVSVGGSLNFPYAPAGFDDEYDDCRPSPQHNYIRKGCTPQVTCGSAQRRCAL